ncbi:SDR family oxidoreductase, partial [Bradyrhizobium sp. LHD-71]|uniref:SDR family NAD(P)-dependent oxidoreductase n=1 Tax=Bradyrhizobium sp. LHD-71 TaxID=3072141 RepID=UPI00280C939F
MADQKPVVAITGAGDGIGWATARAFARNGYRVALLDIDADSVSARARELGAEHADICCDVSKEVEVRAAFRKIADRLGNLDALVNNAGIVSPHLPTSEQTVESFERLLGVHLSGTFLCSREAHAQMAVRQVGSIVNISSIAGISGLPRRNAYGAAKAGIASMTRSMACEWASIGIRVNAVAPGYVATALVKKLESDGFVDTPR